MDLKYSIYTCLLFISIPLTCFAGKSDTTCTATQCFAIKPIHQSQLNNHKVVVYTTKNDGVTYLSQNTLSFSDTPSSVSEHHIELDEKTLAQPNPIIGFGGAFTDSSAMLFNALPKALQNNLLNAYFSFNGLAYSLGRVPMASTDFSCRDNNGNPSINNCDKQQSQYSYAETVNDYSLTHFALQPEDTQLKIPFIKRALAIANTDNIDIKLFASPWSAPAWMKTNHNMVRGNLINSPKIKSAWATYFSKFFQAYNDKDIHFWGVTIQNEPVDGGLTGTNKQWWQTMYSSNDDQTDFIANYLGPELTHNPITQHLTIMMHDDQVTTLTKRIGILRNPDVAKYISGVGAHWYTTHDWSYHTFTDAFFKINPALSNPSIPNNNIRFLLGTEACEGSLPCVFFGLCGPKIDDWSRGEAYAHDILQDLTHYLTGWTDWNLLLDMRGGPNWANNRVDAPMLVDLDKQAIHLQPMYFYMGHFSHFIRPGSYRLHSKSFVWPELEEVTYKVPAHNNLPDTIVTVVLNRNFQGRDFYIHDQTTNQYINSHIPAHAIQTYVYQAKA